jgi:hypothetical protein
MNFGTKLPKNTEEADFVVVTEEEVSHVNLPARMEDVQLLRHKKAEGNPAYLQEIQDDIKLDIELGLKSQFEMDQAKVLRNDIDQLTKSNNYFQVSRKLLNKMFNIDDLKALCFFHNLKELVVESLNGAKRPIVFALALIFSTWATVGDIGACHGSFLFLKVIGAILLCCWDIALFCMFVNCFIDANGFGDMEFNYEFMDVELDIEDVKNTRIELPRIAKLKMKEAKDSELFEGFSIAHPEFKIKKKSFKPNFKLDPAILGVTKDNRMYMICWWDIKKDIDKVRENIRLFKKFKI